MNVASVVPVSPSAIVTSSIEIKGWSAASSFSIVPVASPSTMIAPVAPLSVTRKVSSGSNVSSLFTVTVIVFVVSVAAKSSVPLART